MFLWKILLMTFLTNKPFLERAVIAPLDIAGGVLETAATAIPMLATGVEHGARQLYGKAVKGLSGRLT